MQFGFRKKHSTETAICFFLENVKATIDASGVIGAVFLVLFKTVVLEFFFEYIAIDRIIYCAEETVCQGTECHT